MWPFYSYDISPHSLFPARKQESTGLIYRLAMSAMSWYLDDPVVSPKGQRETFGYRFIACPRAGQFSDGHLCDYRQHVDSMHSIERVQSLRNDDQSKIGDFVDMRLSKKLPADGSHHPCIHTICRECAKIATKLFALEISLSEFTPAKMQGGASEDSVFCMGRDESQVRVAVLGPDMYLVCRSADATESDRFLGRSYAFTRMHRVGNKYAMESAAGGRHLLADSEVSPESIRYDVVGADAIENLRLPSSTDLRSTIPTQ